MLSHFIGEKRKTQFLFAEEDVNSREMKRAFIPFAVVSVGFAMDAVTHFQAYLNNCGWAGHQPFSVEGVPSCINEKTKKERSKFFGGFFF